MARFPLQSLAIAGLLLASRVALAQTVAPGSDLPPAVPVPIQAPPPTYSPWVLALASIALLLLAVAGIKLVMNGLRSSRHHRHRGHHSSNRQ
jgi:capsular polysaccharide biosynthesis protein